MTHLRPYQAQAIADLRTEFARHRRVLYQLPTGGGKTTIFCEIARIATQPVLILVHRQELLLQASASLDRAGVPHQVVAPRHVASLCHATPGAPVVLATIQSAARRTIAPDPALIVLDEAHHATASGWARAVGRWPDARVVGFSATPIRLDGQGLDSAFDSLLCGPTVGELQDAGYLAPIVAYSVASVDMVGIRETDAAAVGRAVTPRIVGCAVEHWETIGRRRPAIAFCHSVEAARALAERFRGRGHAAACIDGQMDHSERQRVVAGLRDGALQVLTSCEIVSEGFDVPGVEVAILLRPTQSLALHLQQIGRAMRPAPGKSNGIVIDAVGNLLRHGLPDDPREWSLHGVPRRATPDDVTPVNVRVCADCFRTFRPAPACPYCGNHVPANPRKIELVDGALREWTRAEVAEARERARRAAHAEVREAARNGLAALESLALRRGYAPTWARNYWIRMRK